MKNEIIYVHILVLSVQCSGDVGKLKKFFNGVEYGRYRVSRIVDTLLVGVFALEDIMGNQLTLVVLRASQHVRDGAVDRIGLAVVDIREVRALERGNNLLHESLIHSRQLLEQTHSVGVCNPHVEIRLGSCAVQDDERTRVSWLDERSR